MNNQGGFGLIRAIVVIVVLFVVAYVIIPSGIKMGRLGYNYSMLKDEMRTVAKFRVMETEEEMKAEILQKAQELGVELWEENVIVDKYPGEKIVIDVYYEKDLVFPFFKRRFKFNLVVEEPLK